MENERVEENGRGIDRGTTGAGGKEPGTRTGGTTPTVPAGNKQSIGTSRTTTSGGERENRPSGEVTNDRSRTTVADRIARRNAAKTAGTATTTGGEEGEDGRGIPAGTQAFYARPNVVIPPEVELEPVIPAATRKPVAKKGTKKEPEPGPPDVTEEIVTSGIKTLFLLIGVAFRPEWALPAWQFEDDEVKRPAQCFTRTLKRLTAEQQELLNKYLDPINGMVELYGVYRMAGERERQLYETYSSVANEATTEGDGINPSTEGASNDNGRNTSRRKPSDGNPYGRFRDAL